MGSKFDEVKVGDKIFREVRGFGRSFHIGEVVHVTKTRFKIDFGNGRLLEYTKDGKEYPRSDVWSRTSDSIKFLDEKSLEIAEKDLHLRRLKAVIDSMTEDVRFLAQEFDRYSSSDIRPVSQSVVEAKNKMKELLETFKNGGNNE